MPTARITVCRRRDGCGKNNFLSVNEGSLDQVGRLETRHEQTCKVPALSLTIVVPVA